MRMVAALGLLCALPVFSVPQTSTGPRLIYTKEMKGSVPAYEKIAVNADGSGEYLSRSPNEPLSPRAFRLSPQVTRKLFALAGKLHDFRGIKLESHKRVADLGLKTLKYENGGRDYIVQFNYSLDRTAQELTDLFESVGSVERHIQALDYAMKYDRLGLPRQLELIQIDLANKALVDPELMRPTLNEIIRNPRFMHLAQIRAESILQQIQEKN